MGFSSGAALRFAGFRRISEVRSSYNNEAILKKIAREFTGNLHKNRTKSPKNSRAKPANRRAASDEKPTPDLSNSDMYRSIAISSLLSNIFDNVVIERQQDFLSTSNYQFCFKAKSSTVLCTTMVNETIQYYIENGGQAVYLLLLDASKAFDKVSYEKLFELLLARNNNNNNLYSHHENIHIKHIQSNTYNRI